MGKINLNRLLYIFRKNLKWVIPKKFRKPFYLFGGVLGLFVYFNVMLNFTKSRYLIAIKNLVDGLFDFLINEVSPALFYVLIILIVVIIVTRYFREPYTANDEKGKQYHGSIYYQVNSIIAFSYTVITILSVLPFVLH